MISSAGFNAERPNLKARAYYPIDQKVKKGEHQQATSLTPNPSNWKTMSPGQKKRWLFKNK
jgi:hypothetical protein